MQKEYPKNLQFYFFKYSKLIFPCRNRHSAWSIALVCVKIHPIQTRPIFTYPIQNNHNRAFTQKQHKAESQHDLCFINNNQNTGMKLYNTYRVLPHFLYSTSIICKNTTLIVFCTVVYCRFLVNFGIIQHFSCFCHGKFIFSPK